MVYGPDTTRLLWHRYAYTVNSVIPIKSSAHALFEQNMTHCRTNLSKSVCARDDRFNTAKLL